MKQLQSAHMSSTSREKLSGDSAGNRTHNLLIMRPTLYHCTTALPLCHIFASFSIWANAMRVPMIENQSSFDRKSEGELIHSPNIWPQSPVRFLLPSFMSFVYSLVQARLDLMNFKCWNRSNTSILLYPKCAGQSSRDHIQSDTQQSFFLSTLSPEVSRMYAINIFAKESSRSDWGSNPRPTATPPSTIPTL
jgi:hypothetical protein